MRRGSGGDDELGGGAGESGGDVELGGGAGGSGGCDNDGIEVQNVFDVESCHLLVHVLKLYKYSAPELGISST